MLDVEEHKINFMKNTNSWVIDKHILNDLEHLGTERNYSLHASINHSPINIIFPYLEEIGDDE
jgi:hypothetical protein